jgi:hypothetical protein
MRLVFLLLLVGGCYTEFGLGARSSAASVHGSVGIQIAIGDTGRGSVRGGGGGAIGGFKSSRAAVPDGDVTPGNVVIGGHARVLGTQRHGLVLDGEVYLPFGGRVYFDNFSTSQAADVTRIYAGIGYRHGWTSTRHYEHDPTNEGDIAVTREAASFLVALGPEVFSTSSENVGDSREIGGAFSITFAAPGWAVWHGIYCLFDMGSKSPDDECSS